MPVVAIALAAGCGAPGAGSSAPDARGVLVIPPIGRGAAGDMRVRFSAPGAIAPSGCFAQSRRTGGVACMLGAYSPASDKGDRHVSLLINEEDSTPDLPIAVLPGARIDEASRSTLDTMMKDGDFVAITAPSSSVASNSSRAYAGLLVELRLDSFEVDVEEERPSVHAPRKTETRTAIKVIVRLDKPVVRRPAALAGESSEGGEEDDVLLENSLGDIFCASPVVTVRVLDPMGHAPAAASSVLIERECELSGEHAGEMMKSAWLCSVDRHRCD